MSVDTFGALGSPLLAAALGAAAGAISARVPTTTGCDLSDVGIKEATRAGMSPCEFETAGIVVHGADFNAGAGAVAAWAVDTFGGVLSTEGLEATGCELPDGTGGKDGTDGTDNPTDTVGTHGTDAGIGTVETDKPEAALTELDGVLSAAGALADFGTVGSDETWLPMGCSA